jgi:hypothetical protein
VDAATLVLGAIKRTTDPYALQALAAGLAALPATLTDTESKEAVEPLLAAIRGLPDRSSDVRIPSPLGPLGTGLDALSTKLTADPAKSASVMAKLVLDEARDRETVAIYAELSAKLMLHEPPDEQTTRIFGILRNPLTAGRLSGENPQTANERPTESLLTVLEHVRGVQGQFEGDVWKAVKWAEAEQKAGHLKGLDLDAPMEVP